MPDPVLLYDEDCGFCTKSAQWAVRLGCRVEATSWQSWPGLAAAGITPQAANAELHLADGTVVSRGHRAVAATLLTARALPLRLAGRVLGWEPLAPVASRVYAWVARNRHRLPGGTPACRIEADR